MIQRTPEWYAERRGRITASKVHDILKGKKGNYLKARETYMNMLAAEIITGKTKQLPPIKAVLNGVEREPMARSAYEAVTGEWVDEVGFIIHPDYDFLGASPDGLVGKDGGTEFKCPETTTHLRLRADGEVNPAYITQMDVGMMCTERKWWDFVSYDPDCPDDKALFILRFPRNEDRIAIIKEEVLKFKDELDALIKSL